MYTFHENLGTSILYTNGQLLMSNNSGFRELLEVFGRLVDIITVHFISLEKFPKMSVLAT